MQRKKECVVIPQGSLFPGNDNESLSFEGINKEDHGNFPTKQVSGSRRFSHILKAVSFGASIARKIKTGKTDKKISRNFLHQNDTVSVELDHVNASTPKSTLEEAREIKKGKSDKQSLRDFLHQNDIGSVELDRVNTSTTRSMLEKAKKIKKGKSDEKSSKNLLSKSAMFNNYHKPSNKDDSDSDFRQRIISHSISNYATSSSASTTIATNSKSECPSCSSSLVTKTMSFLLSSTGSTLQQQSQRGYNICNIGLFLMLISLLVFVFWGKICAIFCTSTCFFFMPLWLNVKDNRPIPIDMPRLENSPERKGKIVMDVATNSNSLCSSCSSSLFTETTSFQSSSTGYCSFNIGLVLMLLNLLVLIFLGNICAIFCTATWFFFIPWWHNVKENCHIPIDTPPSEIVRV